MDYNWLSLLPPIVSIGLAFWKKSIIPALFAGIFVGEIIIENGNVFSAFFHLLDRAISIAGNHDNLQLILFSIMVGSLLALIKESNGFKGFILTLEKLKLGRSPVTAYLLTFIIGIIMFLENWSNVLVNGTTVGPIYDRLGLSRERMAYFIHTISINIVALAIINSWGAFYMTLLQGQDVSDSFSLVLQSVPLNFYSIISLIFVAFVMSTRLTIGPMKAIESGGPRHNSEEKKNAEVENEKVTDAVIKPSVIHLILPLFILITTVLASLVITGGGDIVEGSGSTSVFYAVVTSIIAFSVYLISRRYLNFNQVNEVVFSGMRKFLPIAVLVVLALTLGNICRTLETGVFISTLAKQNVPAFLIPALIFILGAIMSFATGTSYGTFAIMVPIAIPVAQAMGLNPSLLFAACISGGVFGDNCSPISDTSIVTSVAAQVSVIDHVRTQLPYALISATIAILMFIVAGILM